MTSIKWWTSIRLWPVNNERFNLSCYNWTFGNAQKRDNIKVVTGIEYQRRNRRFFKRNIWFKCVQLLLGQANLKVGDNIFFQTEGWQFKIWPISSAQSARKKWVKRRSYEIRFSFGNHFFNLNVKGYGIPCGMRSSGWNSVQISRYYCKRHLCKKTSILHCIVSLEKISQTSYQNVVNLRS